MRAPSTTSIQMTTPADQSIVRRRLDGLDLLRFFAAASVLFYHFYFIGPLQGFWSNTLYTPLAHWGDLGVDLFFVISGFVITLTSENRGAIAFIRARAGRLIPTFFICSSIIAGIALMKPGADIADILLRWLSSQMFFPQVFGLTFLSAVYWTLAIEVQFYGMVAILLALGLWKRFNDLIIWSWLLTAFVLQYIGGPTWLATALISEYAGHFVAGMVLYRINTGQPPRFAWAALFLACALISKHIQHIDEWLGGSYQTFFPLAGIVLAAPTLLATVMLAARAPAFSPRLATAAAVLGTMSYPFYLLHADLGFWSQIVFKRKLFSMYPSLVEWISYPMIAVGAIVLSLWLSWLVATWIEPKLQSKMSLLMLGGQGCRTASHRA